MKRFVFFTIAVLLLVLTGGQAVSQNLPDEATLEVVQPNRNNPTGWVRISFRWNDSAPSFRVGQAFELGLVINPKFFAQPIGGNDKHPNIGFEFLANGENVECGYRDVLNYSNASSRQEAEELIEQYCSDELNLIDSFLRELLLTKLTSVADNDANFAVGTTCPERFERGVLYEIIYYLEPTSEILSGNDEADEGFAWVVAEISEDECIGTEDCIYSFGAAPFGFCGSETKKWINRVCVPTSEFGWSPKYTLIEDTENDSNNPNFCIDRDDDGFFALQTDIMFGSNVGDCDDTDVNVSNQRYSQENGMCTSPTCRVDSDCEDNNVCNGLDICVDGLCTGTQTLACGFEEYCDPVEGCVPDCFPNCDSGCGPDECTEECASLSTPPRGSFVKAPSSHRTYYVENGFAYHIPDLTCLRLFNEGTIATTCVADTILNPMRFEGESLCSEGSFVKRAGEPVFYHLQRGELYPLCGRWDEDALEDTYGHGFELAVTAPEQFFDTYPLAQGQGIYPPGSRAPRCGDDGIECGTYDQGAEGGVCYTPLDCGNCPSSSDVCRNNVCVREDQDIDPYVTVEPREGPIGTLFRQDGFNFSPDSQVILHFLTPSGEEELVNNPPLTTDSRGNYRHSYPSDEDDALGEYLYWGEDVATGVTSPRVSYRFIGCGDDICNNAETCSTCQQDCGRCPDEVQLCRDYEGSDERCQPGNPYELSSDNLCQCPGCGWDTRDCDAQPITLTPAQFTAPDDGVVLLEPDFRVSWARGTSSHNERTLDTVYCRYGNGALTEVATDQGLNDIRDGIVQSPSPGESMTCFVRTSMENVSSVDSPSRTWYRAEGGNDIQVVNVLLQQYRDDPPCDKAQLFYTIRNDGETDASLDVTIDILYRGVSVHNRTQSVRPDSGEEITREVFANFESFPYDNQPFTIRLLVEDDFDINPDRIFEFSLQIPDTVTPSVSEFKIRSNGGGEGSNEGWRYPQSGEEFPFPITPGEDLQFDIEFEEDIQLRNIVVDWQYEGENEWRELTSEQFSCTRAGNLLESWVVPDDLVNHERIIFRISATDTANQMSEPYLVYLRKLGACDENACGGCSELTDAPGESCGTCGEYACEGDNQVICNDPFLGNDCSARGAECGQLADGCGGFITCSSCPDGEVCRGNRCIEDCVDLHACDRGFFVGDECRHEPRSNCCLNNSQCGDAEVCVDTVCTPVVCERSGPCERAEVIDRTCVRTPIEGCCEQDSDCPDDRVCDNLQCTPVSCDEGTDCHIPVIENQECRLEWREGCCLTDAQCPGTATCVDFACEPVVCTPNNQCEMAEAQNHQCERTPVPNCCEGNGDCSGDEACIAMECQLVSCEAMDSCHEATVSNHTCQQTPIANCCLIDSDCPDTQSCEANRCEVVPCSPLNECDINVVQNHECTHTRARECCLSNDECGESQECRDNECADVAPPFEDTCGETYEGEVANGCGVHPDGSDDYFDDDGDCICEREPCEGSLNPTCGTLTHGDCDDKVGDFNPSAVCSVNGELFIHYSNPTCPDGTTLVFLTDTSILNGPQMHDTFGDRYDNNCDGVLDNGGDETCIWLFVDGVYRVSCEWL